MSNHGIGLASRTARLLRLALAGAALAAAASGADAKQPAARELPALFAALEKADAVVEGSGSPARVLYVFFDANCWYCHLTWKALQPYERAGLQVRWVPVAYQKDSSTHQSRGDHAGERPRGGAARERDALPRRSPTTAGSGPAKVPLEALAAQLEANIELMERFGVSGTPALVWKDEKGRVRVEIGMPRLSQLPGDHRAPRAEERRPGARRVPLGEVAGHDLPLAHVLQARLGGGIGAYGGPALFLVERAARGEAATARRLLEVEHAPGAAS